VFACGISIATSTLHERIMKKHSKKALHLSRETIRPLTALELGHAAGGVVQTSDAHKTCSCGSNGPCTM
jgi:hypothetical protein